MSKPRVERQNLERRVDAAVECVGSNKPEAAVPFSCLAHYTKYLLEYTDYAKSSICTAYNKLEIFLRWMTESGIASLSELTTQDVRSFFSYCKSKRGMKGITMRTYRVEMNKFFGYLWSIGTFGEKPPILNRLHFTEKAVDIDIASKEDLSAMIRTAREDYERKKDAWRFDISFKPLRNLCILYLLIATGLRPSEVVGIKTSDLCLEDSHIDINGKGNNLYVKRYRKAYIDQPVLKETLTEYLRVRSHLKTEFLFCSWDGIPLRSMYISTMVRTIGLDAGLGKIINPTTLRHTYCSHLAAQNVDLFCIRELMGHKWIDTSLVHYTHFPAAELRKQAIRFNPFGGEVQ